MVTLQTFPLTLVQPVQLENFDPSGAVAVNVTAVLGLKDTEQEAVQFMPAGEIATEPSVPLLVYVRRYVVAVLNVACTDFAAVIETVHVAPDTVAHPVQPANAPPVLADAVRVTDCPEPKL